MQNWLQILFVVLLTLSSVKSADCGVAVATSYFGEVTIIERGESSFLDLSSRPVFEPSGITFKTGSAGNLFLVFENRVALALGPDTELAIESFSAESDMKVIGPSADERGQSNLQMVLERGDLAISANRLSPLSKVVVQTELGAVNFSRKGMAIRLRPEDDGLTFATESGNITVTTQLAEEKLFVGNQQWLQLLPDGTVKRRAIDLEKDNGLLELTRAANRANARVAFRLAAEDPQAGFEALILSQPIVERVALKSSVVDEL